ncbi:MAG: hypothetical protein IJX69_03435 [Oscillospiraceae bacterium]|nr:hypothetical protein [Oscillospiraceae bacterium]
MERISRFRAITLLVIFGVILVLFTGKLFSLQIIEPDGNTDNTTVYTSITTVKAARGDILDRNGNVLVGNRASYDMVFNHYVIKSTNGRNQYLYNLIKKCQELDIEYIDHFPITATRPFEYTLDDYTTAWQGYFQSYLSERDLDSDMTAPLLIDTLRERYGIPDAWTMEEARAVIGLLYEFDLRGVANLSNYVFIEDISDENLSILLELNTPGLNVESSTVREYYTTYGAHVLGYVGAMDSKQWEYYKTVEGYNMDAMVGQTGLEKAFEEYLHGVDGVRVDKVAKDGTIISQEYKEGYEPKAGANVELTMDWNLQMVAEDALADMVAYLRDPERNPSGDGSDVEGLSVVAMEVKTGDVLVCASYPTFDLANLREKYSEILEADGNPLYNRALQAAYPPGSTFKMTTLVAAMENGHFQYGETIETLGKFRKYEETGFAPACLKYNQSGGNHGIIDAPKALEVSCNYFFFELADRLSIEELDATAAALGLGVATGVELDEELGYRANPETKAEVHKGTINTKWYTGDRINAGIGQSEHKYTPMQLCVYVSTLANKGVRRKATFLNRVVSADYRSLLVENEPAILSTLEMSDATYATVLAGMQQVITGPDGTARNTLKGLSYTVAAKTGTAEHGADKVYSSHGSFVCFAPAEDPQIAIAVYGEKAAHGSTLGQIAKAIMNAYFANEEESAVDSYENTLG